MQNCGRNRNRQYLVVCWFLVAVDWLVLVAFVVIVIRFGGRTFILYTDEIAIKKLSIISLRLNFKEAKF